MLLLPQLLFYLLFALIWVNYEKRRLLIVLLLLAVAPGPAPRPVVVPAQVQDKQDWTGGPLECPLQFISYYLPASELSLCFCPAVGCLLSFVLPHLAFALCCFGPCLFLANKRAIAAKVLILEDSWVAFNGAFNISFGRHCPSNSWRRTSSTWFYLVSRLCCWLVVLACVNFNWLSVHWGKF